MDLQVMVIMEVICIIPIPITQERFVILIKVAIG